MLTRVRIACVCLASVCAALPAHALQTIYVSPCGDDAASGYGTNCSTVPLFKPKRTIQAAINAATFPGDVVIVLPGTYHEAIDFLGRAITVRSSDGPVATTIDAFGLNRSAVSFVSGETPASVLEGFRIRWGTGTLYQESMVGGGVFVEGASPTVRHCTFTDNKADFGGAVASFNGYPRILSCTFIANRAYLGGGALSFIDCLGLVSHCVIDKNISDGSGGGIFCMGATIPAEDLTILNCLISRNHAESAGGGVVRWSGADTRIIGCTFAHNTADHQAPAAYFTYPGDSITNTIMWGSGPPQLVHAPWIGQPLVTYCDIQGGAAGEGNINADPRFVAAAGGDFRIQSTSPCIDAGDTFGSGTVFDLVGQVRALNVSAALDSGVGQFGAVIDMGAYEFVQPAPPPCPGDISHDGLVNGIDLGQLLASWGACP